MKQVIRQFTQILPAVAALLVAVVSCTVDLDSPDKAAAEGGEAMVKFSVQLPGNAPAVRSLAEGDTPALRALSEENEDHVETIDILIFKPGGEWAYTARCSYSDITAPDDGSPLSFTVKMRQGSYDMVMLANARARVAATKLTGKTKSAALAALVEEMPTNGKWIANTSTTGYKPIPMWGDIGSNITILGDMTISSNISLTRMLARVDVEVETSVTNFKITSVHVYNYNTKGTLAPTAANVANVPGSSELKKGPLYYTGSAINSDGKSCAAEIYLFEAANLIGTTPKGLLQRTCLVVGGKYDANKNGLDDTDATYYYRADFSTGTGDTEVFLDVLRNHHYTFSIEEVSGAGHDSAEEAFEGDTRLSAKVTAWNTANLNVTTPGQYFLNVSRDAVTLDAAANSSATLDAETNYAISNQGFSAGIVVNQNEITYNQGSGWLTLSLSNATGSLSQTITLTAEPNTVSEERTAQVRIKAGNLTKVITVTQKGV